MLSAGPEEGDSALRYVYRDKGRRLPDRPAEEWIDGFMDEWIDATDFMSSPVIGAQTVCVASQIGTFFSFFHCCGAKIRQLV